SASSYILGALMCGASTMQKAKVKNDLATNYWEMYPYLPEDSRDFYPALLAAVFVASKVNEWRMEGYELEEKWKKTTVKVMDTIHLAQISAVLNLGDNVLKKHNPQYSIDVLYPGFP